MAPCSLQCSPYSADDAFTAAELGKQRDLRAVRFAGLPIAARHVERPGLGLQKLERSPGKPPPRPRRPPLLHAGRARQVLVSIQGLVLVEQPFYNEPGYEKQVGAASTHPRQANRNGVRACAALRTVSACLQ